MTELTKCFWIRGPAAAMGEHDLSPGEGPGSDMMARQFPDPQSPLQEALLNKVLAQ